MAKRRSAAEEEAPENHERWLVTYADMLTLLFVLFVVLFAMATISQTKFDAFKQSFHGLTLKSDLFFGGTGILSQENPITLNPRVPSVASAQHMMQLRVQDLKSARSQAVHREDRTLLRAEAEMHAALARAGLADAVRFRIDERGLHVVIVTDHVLFQTGQAELLPAGQRIIDVIAPVLGRLPNDISVEGHTDDVPIDTSRFPSNWELSTARATAVVEDLAGPHGITPDRLSATGYADTRPLVPNDTPAHRALNRRVEIVVISTAYPGATPR